MQNKPHFPGGCAPVATAKGTLPAVPPPVDPHIASEAAVRNILGELFDKLPLDEQLQIVESHYKSLFNIDSYIKIRLQLHDRRRRYDDAS